MSIAIKSGAKVLYQWERGVALTASTPCDILRVSREDDRVTDDLYPVVSGSTGTALIPDRMLTESGYLHVSRIDLADGSERVVETARILVRHAAKPLNTASSTKEIGDMQALRMQMAALERAAREGKFDGKDGITPHIGENGNWFAGDVDLGIRAQGEKGDKGDPGDDYVLTEGDKTEIAEMAAGKLQPWIDDLSEAIGELSTCVTPQMYGAVGDGETDDTAAIREAILNCKSGIVFFPTGKYLISESIYIDTHVTIKGEGIDASFIMVNNSGAFDTYALNFVCPSVGGGICDITLTNASNNINTVVGGISIGSEVSAVASAFKCHHVKVTYLQNGIYWHTDWQAYFDHLYIINCANIGLRIDGSDTQFSNINVSKCKCGVHVGAGTTKITNLKIDNCNTGNIYQYALRVYGHGNQIINTEVQYCYPSGVIVTGSSNVIDIRIDGIGNDVLGNVKDGGYYYNISETAKNNDIRMFISKSTTSKASVLNPTNDYFMRNRITITSNSEIPLLYLPNKYPTNELTGYSYLRQSLTEIKNANKITGKLNEDGTLTCSDGQCDIILLENLFPNINTATVYSSVLRVVTDKPINTPFIYYTGFAVGQPVVSVKMREELVSGQYTTYFVIYSKKPNTANEILQMTFKSVDNVGFTIYELKAVFYDENITLDIAPEIIPIL